MRWTTVGLVSMLAVGCVAIVGCGDDDASVSVTTMSQRIGTEGGTVELPGGGKVQIPAGALNREVTITVTRRELDEVAALPSQMEAAGKPYSFEPHGQVFSAPVKIEVPFEGDDTEVRPMKLPNEDATTSQWTTVFPSEKMAGKLAMDTTSFSVIVSARPRRGSGVVTLPDGAIVQADGGEPDSSVAGMGGDAGTGGVGGDAGDSGTGGTGGTGGQDAGVDSGSNGQDAGVDSGMMALMCSPGTADCDEDPLNGCEVQINSNNAMHCGGCGRTCGGATCTTGRCNATTLLSPGGASNLVNLLLTDNRVYGIQHWGSAYAFLYGSRTPSTTELAGTVVQPYSISTPASNIGAVRGLTTDGTYVYWGVSGTPSVAYRFPVNGTVELPQAVFSTTPDNQGFAFLQLHDGRFYWIDHVGTPQTIKSRPFADAANASDTVLVEGITRFWQFHARANRVVWVDNVSGTYHLRMASLDETPPLTPVDIATATAEIRTAVDDTHVYFTVAATGANGKLARADLSTGTVTDLVPGLPAPNSTVVDGTHAYYAQGTIVYRVPKAGGIAPVGIGNVGSTPTLFDVDDDFIYVRSGSAGSSHIVTRVAK